MSLHSTRIPLAGAALAVLLAGCGAVPPKPSGPIEGPPVSSSAPPSVSGSTSSSKYYSDDGPPLASPADLDRVPDAVPRLEPLHRFANRPYTVLGRDYVPATMLRPYREQGTASWYGRKFHGQKTSIGEVYDMFAMTAAHPTLPLPSYARVTNAASGRSVVVRVNDRGPFLHGRVIDLSYAAATRLDIAQRGSGEVIVEAIVPVEAGTSVAKPLPSIVDPAAGASAFAGQRPVSPEPAPPAERSGGFIVQLGAFANFANAQTFLAHVQNQTGAAQVEPRVRQVQGLWRVYVGPYADRDEARRVAERIASVFGITTSLAIQ